MDLIFQSDGWFYQNPSLSEVRKVNYLAMSMHPDRQLWWKSHADEQLKGRSPTVTNVYTWAEGLLDDPRTRAIDAYVRWDKAAMRQNQPIQDFSSYLNGLESKFPFQLSEEHKKFGLLAKVPEHAV